MVVEIPTSFTSEVIREVAGAATEAAPTVMGLGLDTITGVALGGTGVGAAVGAYKLIRGVLNMRRKVKGGESPQLEDPFPHRLDEAREHRLLRQRIERRAPEYDAAVGRIFDDHLQLYRERGTEEDRKVLNEFNQGIRDHVAKLCPPSTREYVTTERS